MLEENKLNAATQQLIIFKMLGWTVKQGSKTLITASEQFTTAESNCANVLWNTSSGA